MMRAIITKEVGINMINTNLTIAMLMLEEVVIEAQEANTEATT